MLAVLKILTRTASINLRYRLLLYTALFIINFLCNIARIFQQYRGKRESRQRSQTSGMRDHATPGLKTPKVSTLYSDPEAHQVGMAKILATRKRGRPPAAKYQQKTKCQTWSTTVPGNRKPEAHSMDLTPQDRTLLAEQIPRSV